MSNRVYEATISLFSQLYDIKYVKPYVKVNIAIIIVIAFITIVLILSQGVSQVFYAFFGQPGVKPLETVWYFLPITVKGTLCLVLCVWLEIISLRSKK